MAVLFLCGFIRTAAAAPPAQRLGAWSQRVMQRWIAQDEARRAAQLEQLKALIRQMEQAPEVLPGTERIPSGSALPSPPVGPKNAAPLEQPPP